MHSQQQQPQVIGARRASWRIISSIEQKEESKGNSAQVEKIKTYRTKVEAELADVCNDILAVLDQHLIPSAQAGESKVFYHKMYVLLTCHLYCGVFDVFANYFTDCAFYFAFFSYYHLTGRVIITDTSPSSLQVTTERVSAHQLQMEWTPLQCAQQIAKQMLIDAQPGFYNRRFRGRSRVVQAGYRDRSDRPRTYSPNPTRSRTQLLRILLRDPQLTRPCMPSCQAGFR